MGSCVRPMISLCSAPRGKQYSSNRSTEDEDEEDEDEDEEEDEDEDDEEDEDEEEEDSRGIASSSSVPPTAMR